MENKIRVLVVDDHEIVRAGICAAISREPDIEVVGEAGSAQDAVEKARCLEPDVIMMDLVMPGGGIEAIDEINSLKQGIRILVLTSYTEDDMIIPAIRAGAGGYALKDQPIKQLVHAVRMIYRGESPLDPRVAHKLIREYTEAPKTSHADKALLTMRETEVLKLVGAGLSNHEISVKLFISERTVRTHVTNILGKLELTNRTQAALYALRNGLVQLDEPV